MAYNMVHFSLFLQLYFFISVVFSTFELNKTKASMLHFKNVFLNLGTTMRIDFEHLAEVRRAKLIQEGYDVERINWALYVKVLKEKQRRYNS